jgi:hypothetical protein
MRGREGEKVKARILAVGVLILAAWACEMGSRSGESPEIPFEVTVRSMGGGAVAGATIEGGVDWEMFRAETDARGKARLPHYARGEKATLFKTNTFPLRIEGIKENTYWLYSTPRSFRPIGDVEGWAIRFGADTLITLEYQGRYHLYAYNDTGVTEIAAAELPWTAKETQLHGDRLWFTTHEDGVYVYSLEDPFRPLELFHLAIPGYLGPFALRENLIVVVGPEEWDRMRVFSYDEGGNVVPIAEFGSEYYVTKMVFRGSYLIVLGGQSLPTVYDLADPTHPRLVYKQSEPGYWLGTLFGHHLLLTPQEEEHDRTIKFKLIDLSDPAHPAPGGFAEADSTLIDIIDASTAIGRYSLFQGAVSVLRGDITGGFETIAIVTEGTSGQIPFHESEGNLFPYFIIGGRLWKLED